MNIKEIAKKYLEDLTATINTIDLNDIQKVADVIIEAYEKDRMVFICGNGGSATTASHMACDFGKGTLKNVYNQKEKRFRVMSLTDNVAVMTAFGNDLSFEDIFYQQLHNLIKPKDVVIAISGSGNSANIIRALMYAKEQRATTIGLLGYKTGGKALEFTDHSIVIQSNDYGVIEDIHLSLNHLLTVCLGYAKKHIDSKAFDKSK